METYKQIFIVNESFSRSMSNSLEILTKLCSDYFEDIINGTILLEQDIETIQRSTFSLIANFRNRTVLGGIFYFDK